nr:hypothetical protein [Tanacetum cinerariifolium]
MYEDDRQINPDSEGNIQPVNIGLLSTSDEGIHSSKPLHEGKRTNAKDPEENIQTSGMRSPATHPDEASLASKHFDNYIPITERVLAKTLQGFLEVQYARVAEDNLDDVKEDPALNKKVLEAAKAYTKNSLSLTKLLTLVTDFDFPGFNSTIKSLQAAVTAQNDHLTRWTKSFASLAWNVGRRMTRIKNTQATIKSDIVSL